MTIKSEMSAELNEPIELTDAEVAAVAGGLLNFSNAGNLTNVANPTNFGNNSNATASGTGSTSVAGIAVPVALVL